MCNGEYNSTLECIMESTIMCNGEYNGSMESTVVH